MQRPAATFTPPADHRPAIHREGGRAGLAIAGAVSLAVAMGIGRFAFTPLLPMMLHDGSIDLHAASWLASTNYLGYLVGALLCTFEPMLRARAGGRLPPLDGPLLVRTGLLATAVLTFGMALPLPALWPALRFAAGVASAVVFVHTAGFCLTELARRGSAELGAAIFTGPGAGIVVSGLFASAMVGWQWQASTAWAIHAVLALLLTAAVWRVFHSADRAGVAVDAVSTGEAAAAGGKASSGADSLPAASTSPPRPAEASTSAPPPAEASTSAPRPAEASTSAASTQTASTPAPGRGGEALTRPVRHGEIAWLAVAYGLAGFGYIVTATFLPVIARVALPGSAWLDLFWPIFGGGVTAGALLATRTRQTGDLRLLLAGCYAVQALGIFASLWQPSLAGFAIGSLLLGLPFTAITFFAMQEVRRLRPASVAPFMGLLTALYGVGQIIGPPMVAVLLRSSRDAGAGFGLSLEIAASALLLGALLYLGMSRIYPAGASKRT